MRRYAAATSLPLQEAAARASGAAARLLGLEGKKGSLGVGCDADLVVLDGEGQVPVIMIVITVTITIPSPSPLPSPSPSPPPSFQVLLTIIAGEFAWVAPRW